MAFVEPPAPIASWTAKQTVAQGSSFYLDPRVHKVKVGLAWDAGVDVDSSAVLIDKDYRVVDIVWFRQLRSRDGSVSHRSPSSRRFFPCVLACASCAALLLRLVACSGDDRTGEGGGDDETISVKLADLPPQVHYVLFVVNVFNRSDFSVVKACTVRMYHGSSKAKFAGHTLMEFRLSQDKYFNSCRGVFMSALARHNAWWSVHALGLPAK